MGQGASQPVGSEPDGGFPEDSDAQIAPGPPDLPIAVKKNKSPSQQENQSTVQRKRKSSQSSTASLSTPSIVEDSNPLSRRESQPSIKRKRKSSQSGNNPPATSPKRRPGSAKRKRLIDSLSNNNTPAAERINGSTPSDAQNTPRSELGASSTRPPKSLASSVKSKEHQPSPSPVLSVGSSQAKGRLNRTNGVANAKGTTGAFLPDEVTALEDYKVQFCNSHRCPTATFDLMVQHGKEGPFPGPVGVPKRIFWQDIHKILPDRDRRSVYRFMKRHFQASDQKAHDWTEEQEDELVELYQKHGPKFAQIAEILGRGSDDVVQRWKNRLEHRDTMKTGAWSDEEMGLLKAALRAAWSKMKDNGYDVGENIFEMDESLISWSQISSSLEHVRSRQQCADKWRRYKQLAVAPTSQPNSRATSRVRSVTPSTKKRRTHFARNRKSSAYVLNSDEESEPESGSKPTSSTLAHGQGTGSGPQPSKQTSPNEKSRPREETQATPSSDSETESSSDSDSDAKSNAGEDSEPALRAVHKQEASEDTSSDESSDTSSSEEESDNEGEIPTTTSVEPAPAESSKRKRTGSSARGSGTPDGKRVKVKKEPSPTPSAIASHESGGDSESESDSDDESTSSDKDSAVAIKKRASSSESESDSDDDSDSESESESESESDSDRKIAVKNSPDEQKDQALTAIKQSGSSSDSNSSDDSDATDSSDESEDEVDAKVPIIKRESEPAGEALLSPLKQDNDSEDAKTSSTSSSDESDSDSESESSSDSE
ncbi:MYB DNA-binding domain protein [Aspergillus mulundensis]|uniref:Uncharacterized protein n=1 Tax=Aspergillus mulundensis TaxID=1810919 RepID=A0A3D8REB7_9EURO|nr:hypothetical protein DSM5745_07492 [Aspergillus mulundensis]RDW72320.1 hypothetical protein DSM5745_07492 [Aspergillus mulundensis]